MEATPPQPESTGPETSGPETPASTAKAVDVPASTSTDEPGAAPLYTVHLDRFDGPLDLLLYLIQRDEIDIYDIPISHITQQYLQTLELLDVFNLDNAGDFLVMAATLMRIKARLLLPVQRSGEDDEDEGDPRDELVRRLLEYKKYKEASQEFGEKEEARSHYYRRGTSYPFVGEDDEPPELSLSLFDLLRAVRNVLDQIQGEQIHQVYTEVYTVEGQREKLFERLSEVPRLRFEELFTGMKVKMEVVVTFIAILDLLKSQRIRVEQARIYGDLWISLREPEPEVDDDDVQTSAEGIVNPSSDQPETQEDEGAA